MMIDKESLMTPEKALALVASLQFRPFEKADWMSFSGCNTDNPLIAESDEYLVIVDGNEIEVFVADTEYEGFQFVLKLR